MHLPQHWIPSSTHSTVHIRPLLPPITPCIFPWHSYCTHHPALLLISQTHNHSQLHLSLNTPSLTTQHSTSITLNTLSTAWLSDHTVPFFPTGLYASLITHYVLLCISPWIHHTSLHHIIPIQMIPKTAHHTIHSMCSLQHIIPIQQVPNTESLIEHTQWSGLARYMSTAGTHCCISFQYSRFTGLASHMKTASAQDWPDHWKTQSAQDLACSKTH